MKLSIEPNSELASLDVNVPRRCARVHSSNADSYPDLVGTFDDDEASLSDLELLLLSLDFLSELVNFCNNFAAFAFSVDVFSMNSFLSPLELFRRGGATGIFGLFDEAMTCYLLGHKRNTNQTLVRLINYHNVKNLT